MKREYVCSNCGLIWFDGKMVAYEVECLECGNTMDNFSYPIFSCDGHAWSYAHDGVIDNLKSRGKEIHYHQEHPWYGKEKDK